MKFVEKVKNNFYSFKDVWLFICIFFWATVLSLIVKFLSLPRTMQMITPSETHTYDSNNKKSDQEKIVKYTDYILNLNFWIYRATCLKRALLLYHFLKKIGINVVICFGVKFNENLISKDKKENLDGHAWLLLDGEIFLEKNTEMVRGYKITYRFPIFRPEAEHRLY